MSYVECAKTIVSNNGNCDGVTCGCCPLSMIAETGYRQYCSDKLNNDVDRCEILNKYLKEESEKVTEYSLKDLTKILNDHSVHFTIQHKRINGEHCGRNCWEIIDINDESIKECIWEGFETAEDCIANLIETLGEEN